MKLVEGFQDLNREEIEAQLKNISLSPSLSSVLFYWVYRKKIASWEELPVLSREKTRRLNAHLPLICAKIVGEHKGEDGSRKYVISFSDGKEVETVLLPMGSGFSLCISTQVGCPVGCPFCATGRMGFYRNLTVGEIVEQYRLIARHFSQGTIQRLVFFGMGEPFLNYPRIRKAWAILMDDAGANFSRRKITVSTVGIRPFLEQWMKEGPEVNLAISLHTTSQNVRKQLVPFSGCYPLEQLHALLREYSRERGKQRQIMIEYVLLRGVNDGKEDARRLAHFLRPIYCKVNVIPYNPVPGADFQRPDDEQVWEFVQEIRRNGYPAYIRESKGLEIFGACGQLMRTYG
ncbi:MAG: 23S rRNA (adenine(2503)-C(2))-methyltransferase RlmN [bacterium JZ-2024 1]